MVVKVADSFVAGADSDLEDWTPDTTGTGYTLDSGSAGAVFVEADTDTADVSTGTISFYFPEPQDMGDPDMYVEVVLGAGTGSNYVCLRATDYDHWIGFRHTSASACQVYRRNAGWASKGTFTATAGDTVRFEVIGDDWDVYVNGSGTPALSFTDSFQNTTQTPGIRTAATASDYWRSWEFGNFLTGGTGIAVPIVYHHRQQMS